MLPEMIGAVIYVRVSTKEQTENLSLPTQLKACEEYCQRQGLPWTLHVPFFGSERQPPQLLRVTTFLIFLVLSMLKSLLVSPALRSVFKSISAFVSSS